jgi:murein DD-endopeptidase MepM/ murein hydrolase activator NlpD
MKKALIIIMLLNFSKILIAQDGFKVYYEAKENGYFIYADNDEFCPVSVKIDFKLTNLKSADENEKVYLVSSQSKRVLLTELNAVKVGASYKLSFNAKYCYGDNNQTTYDKDYSYYLPFNKGQAFLIYQGYNGSFSHRKENSLDFTMPIGTEVTAIRDGIVIKVVNHNNKTCGYEDCKKYNNYITVYHSDGTFAVYTHIKKNSDFVKAGQSVKQGDVIAFSGNVGYSTGPHLHLSVFLERFEKRESLETKFLVGDGKNAEILIEKNTYQRNY